ncbi:MAG: lipoate--protein ligase [Oscillospiraceae bacterium]|nr:lipoate--protein ligase [Oscillospiraceae bacterium]
MITRLKLCQSPCFDPYYNLALEEYLLETVGEGECILYLWRNENTVVIGRNQNPWKECATTLLEQEGGHLARRLSGGGAVFHDLGNLNFTFLMPRQDYDLQRQLRVIREGVQSLGIPAELSGRNDVLADGRKFSGNAFYKSGKSAYHHGTLLIAGNMEKLSRYLTPSKAKLESKGVASVRSRVVNLREFVPGLTVEDLSEALAAAFRNVYAAPLTRMEVPHDAVLQPLVETYRSWEWNYGKDLPFTCSAAHRFPWGSVEVTMDIRQGVIRNPGVFTDAMEWELAERLRSAIDGCRYCHEALFNALTEFPDAEALCRILLEAQ